MEHQINRENEFTISSINVQENSSNGNSFEKIPHDVCNDSFNYQINLTAKSNNTSYNAFAVNNKNLTKFLRIHVLLVQIREEFIDDCVSGLQILNHL